MKAIGVYVPHTGPRMAFCVELPLALLGGSVWVVVYTYIML